MATEEERTRRASLASFKNEESLSSISDRGRLPIESLDGCFRLNMNAQLQKGTSVSSMSSITSELDSSVLASSITRRRKLRLDSMGLSTLRFSSVGLHGREEEIVCLNECLSRLMKSTSTDGTNREFVLISGVSGTGKTALASSLRGPVKQHKGTFLSGKFDSFIQNEPHSAIALVCCDLCGQVLSMRGEGSEQKSTFDDIRKKIIDNIDNTELVLLTNIVPSLEEVIGSIALPISQNVSANQSSLEMRTRLVYAFQKFIRIMASFFAPLVIVLDDLQWSQISSLTLIETLLTDELIENLIIIGCCRSNEVDETHHLSKCLEKLKRKDQKDGFAISEIKLGNLSIAAANKILMDILGIDDESFTMPLARLCHKRTLGNAFFLLEFIAMMREKEIIVYNMATFKWSWDIENVENQTAATGNVVNLLMDKMKMMTNDAIRLLQIASCLGGTFDKKILFLVWEKLPQGKTSCLLRDSASFDELLNNCIEEGFLEMIGLSSCRFIHDNVQEVAMSLVPSKLLPLLQHDIGMTLLDELEEDDLEASIFIVTNLLNSSAAENIRIAEINLRASERAKSMSAFSSASAFAAKGISLLPLDAWKYHFQLTLTLYSIGAEAECYSGNVEKAKYYCREVLRQENLSMIDKRRIYLVSIENKDGAGYPEEALEICLDILKQNGCKFPKSKIKRHYCAITGLLRLQKCPLVEQITNKQISSDPEKQMMMNLMLRATTMAYRTSNVHLGLISTIRRVRWSMQHGLYDESPTSLAQIGYILMHSLGKIKEGVQYGKIALLLLEKTPNSFHTSQTILVLFGYIFSWVYPYQTTSKKYLEGYEIGMQVGNVEWAMWHILCYVNVQLLGSKPLEEVDEDCSIYVPQTKGLKKRQVSELLALVWQTVDNLTGTSDNTTVLSGNRMNEGKLLNEMVPSTSSTMLALLHSFYKSFLCVIFGDHELGAKVAIERGDRFSRELPGQFTAQFEPFFRGISLYEMARKTNEAKYKQHAKKVRSKLKRWVKNGFVNVVHHLKILDAEKAALSGKSDVASKLYEEACILAARQGCIYDVALANERYAELLLESKDQSRLPDAVYRLNEAIKLYLRWGAHAKVQMLLAKHADVLPGST